MKTIRRRGKLFLGQSIGKFFLDQSIGIDENNSFQLKFLWVWQTFFGQSIGIDEKTFFGLIDRY